MESFKLIYQTFDNCRALRKAMKLDKAQLRECNGDDCPLHTDCPVLIYLQKAMQASAKGEKT